MPLLDAATAVFGRKPGEVSADAGFCRESNLAALEARKIRGYLAPGRAAHGAPDPSGRRLTNAGTLMAKMAARRSAPAGARAIGCASRRSSR